ncbi:MAG: hypothetical protein NZ874_07105 [Fimbriimonadales bacterium]|nr:hypothetical protein [Fimbriimonadales bacterium]
MKHGSSRSCADEADLRRLFSPRRRAWFAQQRLQPLGACAILILNSL